MPISIKYTNDLEMQSLKCVIYGFAGAGKTVLCSTAPKPVIISAEKGLISLKRRKVPYIEVKTLNDINAAYKYLKDNDEFQTICLDSLSEITEVVFYNFLKSPEVITNQGKVNPMKAYGLLGTAMIPMIRNFRDMEGKNVIFTSKAKRIVDEEAGGAVNIEPMLPGRVVPDNLPYMVDELLYLNVDRKGNRELICHPSKGILAKDRSGELSDKEKPDISYIFDKIAT